MTGFAGQHIWIIGASTGIGEALARNLSRQGAVLALSSRDGVKLEQLRDQLGSIHAAYPLDISNAVAVLQTTRTIAAAFPRLDRVINLASIYSPMPLADLDLEKVGQLMAINLLGTFNLIHAILPVLRRQQGGQLAVCGSVAGYRGLPHGQPYSASKAAIINLAETLRAEEAPNNIDVRLINPGFVRTPMTELNKFPMPMIIEPEEAAESLAQGLSAGAFEISFPKKFTFLMKLLRLLPDPLFFRLSASLIK